jgi:hypothetical protein
MSADEPRWRQNQEFNNRLRDILSTMRHVNKGEAKRMLMDLGIDRINAELIVEGRTRRE